MIKIYPASRFKKSYKRLSLEIKRKAEQKFEIFVSNPFHPLLKTHKLKGKLKIIGLSQWTKTIEFCLNL